GQVRAGSLALTCTGVLRRTDRRTATVRVGGGFSVMRDARSLRAALPLVFSMAVALALPTPALAQTAPNKCVAGKIGCVAKEAAAFVKCFAKAEKAGTAISDDCLAKARTKFLGASNADSCFAKLEAKEDAEKPASVCRTHDDTALMDALSDALAE